MPKAHYWTRHDMSVLSAWGAKENRLYRVEGVGGGLKRVEQSISSIEPKAVALVKELIGDDISLKDWQSSMLLLVKEGFSVAALAAEKIDGREQEFARAIESQLGYLGRLGFQIEHGQQLLDGAFEYRSKMYANAPRGFYNDLARKEARALGKTQERRMRHADDSNKFCVEAAAKSWAPIGALPRIGDGPLGTMCKCRLEFK